MRKLKQWLYVHGLNITTGAVLLFCILFVISVERYAQKCKRAGGVLIDNKCLKIERIELD